jgi:hypothetical protein
MQTPVVHQPQPAWALHAAHVVAAHRPGLAVVQAVCDADGVTGGERDGLPVLLTVVVVVAVCDAVALDVADCVSV